MSSAVSLKSRFAAVLAGRAYPYQTLALAGLHLAALAVLLMTEETPVARAAFLLTWGLLELRVAGRAAAPTPGGGDLARPDRRADPAVAVQARRPADDGDVCRRDDHRHRHLHVPADGLPGPGLEGRGRDHCRFGGAGGALARRSVPRPPVDRSDRGTGVLRGPCLAVLFGARSIGRTNSGGAITSPSSCARPRSRSSI